MAVGIRDDSGAFLELFPSHDPDRMDAGLALEVARDKAQDALNAAVRSLRDHEAAWHKPGEEFNWSEWTLQSGFLKQDLWDRLNDYDAAVAALAAHDDRADTAGDGEG